MNKDITTKQPTGVALAPRGFDDDDDDSDIIIPRVMLCQAMSDAVQDGQAKAGDIVDSISNKKLDLEFTPIFKYFEYIKFDPEQKGSILWKTRDPSDPRVKETKFGPNGEKPTANKIMNFLCKFKGLDSPIILSFAKTSYKAGKKLNSLAKFSQKDMFASKYNISCKKETSNGNTYYVFDVSPAGKTDDKTFQICEQWYNEFHPKRRELNTAQETDTFSAEQPATDWEE